MAKMLALLAHPDDETFIFGGTISHYTKKGAQVTVVSATKGEMGRRMGNPPFITRESMPIVREQELKDACRILGADEPVFLGIRDKTVEFQEFGPLVEQLMRIIHDIDPEVVFTFHPIYGGHPDHCAIGKAAIRAVQAAEDEGGRSRALYFITFGETMKHPERYGLSKSDIVRIDVSDSHMEKLAAFRAHRCQTEQESWVWLPDREAASRFGKYEYFIIGDKLPRKNREDLFV